MLLEGSVRLSWAITVEHSDGPTAEAFSTGSVLESVPQVGFMGTILGSGKLYEDTVRDLSAARVLAQRGPLTAPWHKGPTRA